MGQFNKAQLAALLAGVVVLTGSETATLTALGESVLTAIVQSLRNSTCPIKNPSKRTLNSFNKWFIEPKLTLPPQHLVLL